jgi:hypothetical protein
MAPQCSLIRATDCAKMTYTIDAGKLIPSLGLVTYMVTFHDFGGPVKITPPDDADIMPLDEFLEIAGLQLSVGAAVAAVPRVAVNGCVTHQGTEKA